MGAPKVVFKQIFGDHWNDSIFLIMEEKVLRTSNTWWEISALYSWQFFFYILPNLVFFARRKGKVATVNLAWNSQSSNKFCLNRKVSPV